MGKKKSQNKGATSLPNAAHSINVVQPDINPITSPPAPNMSQWTSAEVENYEKLLIERDKLQQEKEQLEQLAEKRKAEIALLDLGGGSMDNAFAKRPGSDFKYVGNKSCCLQTSFVSATGADSSQNPDCHHEVCSRARTKGISFLEMDAIKYYDMRLYNERSDRIKAALKKQREVELERVKKVEDEEAAVKARKSAVQSRATSATHKDSTKQRTSPADDSPRGSSKKFVRSRQLTQELDERPRADRVSTDQPKSSKTADLSTVNPVIPSSSTITSGAVRMPAIPIDTDADGRIWFGTPVDRLPDNVEEYKNAAESMVRFFNSATPQQVENALVGLTSQIETKDMSEYTRASFESLKKVMAEAKIKGSKIDVDVSGPPASFINDTSQADWVASTKTIPLCESFQSLWQIFPEEFGDAFSKVEQEAIKVMFSQAEKMSSASLDTVQTSLGIMKDDYVQQSSSPRMTDTILTLAMRSLGYIHKARSMIQDANHGMTQQEIAARITTIVLENADRKPDQYLKTLDELLTHFQMATNDQLPPTITESFGRVGNSMADWLYKRQTRSQPQPKALELLAPGTSKSATPRNSKSLAFEASTPPTAEKAKSATPEIAKPAASGILKPPTSIQSQNMADPQSEFPGIHNFLVQVYERGYCTGVAAVLLARHMADLAKRSIPHFHDCSDELATILVSDHFPSTPQTWYTHFRYVAQTMLDFLYAMTGRLRNHFTKRFEESIAATMMADIMTAALMASTTEQLHGLLKAAKHFVLDDGGLMNPEVTEILNRLQRIATAPELRCPAFGGDCRQHLEVANSRLKGSDAVSQPFRPCLVHTAPMTDPILEDPLQGKNVLNDQKALITGAETDRVPRDIRRTLDTAVAILDLADAGGDIAKKGLKLMELKLRALRARKKPISEVIVDAVTRLRVAANPGDKDDVPSPEKATHAKHTQPACHGSGSETQQRSVVSGEFATLEPSPRNRGEAVRARRAVTKRIQEIIDGKANLAYYSWVAKKIRRDAGPNFLSAFERFERYFKTIGPIPPAFKLALEQEKARSIENTREAQPEISVDGQYNKDCEAAVLEDIETVLAKISATNEPFVSEEDWRIRKLSLHSSALLTDCKLVSVMASESLGQLRDEPDNFDVHIASVLESYLAAGVPVSQIFLETIDMVKEFAREGRFEDCEVYMKDLYRMMIARWRLATVELPLDSIKKGKEANRRLRAEEKRQQENKWKIDVDRILASDWLCPQNKSVTDLNAPFATSQREELDDDNGDNNTLTPSQLDTMRRNNFVKELKNFVLKWARSEALSEKMSGDADYAGTMQKWSEIENERAHNALLAGRAVAEVNGWQDVVDDINRAIQAAEIRDDNDDEWGDDPKAAAEGSGDDEEDEESDSEAAENSSSDHEASDHEAGDKDESLSKSQLAIEEHKMHKVDTKNDTDVTGDDEEDGDEKHKPTWRSATAVDGKVNDEERQPTQGPGFLHH